MNDGTFVLDLEGRSIEAEQVVVATGPFQAPHVPKIAEQLESDVFQIHSTAYRNARQIPNGTVLVVGGGNTGFQIAQELSSTHRVHLAVGSRQTPFPQTILGRDLFWWLTRVGLLNKTVESRIGRRLRERETLIGSSPRELGRRYGVDLKPRALSASGRTVTFADGSDLGVDSVIWATGYRPDPKQLGPRLALVEILRGCDFGRRPSVRKGAIRARPKPARSLVRRKAPPIRAFEVGPPGFEPGTNGL